MFHLKIFTKRRIRDHHGELTDAIDKLAEQLGHKPDAAGDFKPPDALTITLLLGVNATLEWLIKRELSRAVRHRLQRCGYVAVRNPEAQQSGGLWKINSKRQVIYARIELAPAQRLAAARALKDRLMSGLKLVVDNEPKGSG